MGYNISLLSGETAPEIYTNAVHNRPSTSITSGLTRSSMSLSSACGAGMQRGLKRTSSDVCYEQDGRQIGLSGDCGSDIVDDGFTSTPQKGSPPSNGKKTKGRVKIKMEYIDNKLRRYTTFSKRKTGIMKKVEEYWPQVPTFGVSHMYYIPLYTDIASFDIYMVPKLLLFSSMSPPPLPHPLAYL
uniref:MADS-box domain-containing protein n=1 Tax=Rhodnius prolixus TaxID=13249 RepID=T1HCI8_RHOPR